jgi:hypothetical protein
VLKNYFAKLKRMMTIKPMTNEEIALQIVKFIESGFEAAEAQGVDKSTYGRLLLSLADEKTLEMAERLAGSEVLEKWISIVRAGGRN